MKKNYTLSLLFIFASFTSQAQTGFVENKGQVVDQLGVPNSDALFVLPLAGMNVVVYEDGFSYNVFQSKEGYVPASEIIRNNVFIDAKQLKEDAKVNVYRVDMRFMNSTLPNVRSVGKQQGVKNYYTTGTPVGGVTGVNTFEKVFIEGIYPGIDIELVYSKSKGFEYNFIISAEGDYHDIKMKYFGLEEMNVENGLLKMKIKEGVELEERIPASWIKQNNNPLAFNYQVKDDIVSFTTDEEISENEIIIDPTPNLVYATYFGGEGLDYFYDAEYDEFGALLIAGSTGSNENIATMGAYQSQLNGISNSLLLKFNTSDILEWCTYYGGESDDASFGIELIDGGLFLSGFTFSTTGVATEGAFQSSLQGFNAGFISNFTSNGELLKATYYGNGNDIFLDLKISSNGFLVACGSSQSETLPFSENGFQLQNGGLVDGLITGFDSGLNPIFSTFIGGSDLDAFASLSVDSFGNIYLGGTTKSLNLDVTPNAIQSTYMGSGDVLLVRCDSDFSINFISYYGSSEDESRCRITTTSEGLLVFFTATSSSLYVSSQAEQQTILGLTDVYMCQISNELDVVFGGYIGGNESEYLDHVLLFEDHIYLLGATSSTSGIASTQAPFDFMHVNPESGNLDIFIMKLNNNYMKEWGTYFGDYSFDLGAKLLIKDDELTLVGSTRDTSNLEEELQAPFSTQGAYQSEHYGGLEDGFIARFDAVTGIREYDSTDLEWRIFPNPSPSQINLQLPVGERNWKVDFYDLQGRKILQTVSSTDFKTIDISSLPIGVYTVKASNENHSLSMKVVRGE